MTDSQIYKAFVYRTDYGVFLNLPLLFLWHSSKYERNGSRAKRFETISEFVYAIILMFHFIFDKNRELYLHFLFVLFSQHCK